MWLISQDITNNRSKVGWQLWIDKTAYSPTSSGGLAARWMKLDGAFVHEYYGNGFDFTSGTNYLIASGEQWINHNTDGTKSLSIQAQAEFDILGTTPLLSTSTTLPAIPRASVPTFEPSAALVTGQNVTIATHRASTSFTHDITYTFQGQTGTVVTALPTDYVWAPPQSMLTAIPNATSGSGYITTVTKNGSTVVGSKNTNFTLTAAPTVIPTWTSVGVAEGTTSPAVATIMGSPTVFVQGISKVTGSINGAAGVSGSTITSKKFTVAGQMYTVDTTSATSAVLASSGTYNVDFEITDSRGRKKSQSQSITVLPYTAPSITAVTAQRATSGGTPDPNGIYIRVDVTAAVQSLINASTQKNRRTVRIYTSPRGANTWTLRATPANASTTLSGTVTATFGATAPVHFPTGSSFDVKVEVADQFNTSAPTTALGSVSTAGVMTHFRPGEIGVGMGKFWEQGTLDVAGPIYRDNSLVIAQNDAASNAETATGTATNKFVTPAGLASRVASETVAGVAELATLAEVRANDAARVVTPAKMVTVVGQKIMVPTASTGTINADGSVTFSALTSIALDGIFTTEFPRYKVFFEITALSALSSLFLNFRTAGVTNTTAVYQTTRDYGSGGTTNAVSSANQTRLEVAGASSTAHDGELTIFGPTGTTLTRVAGITTSITSGNVPIPAQTAGFFNGTTAFSGLQLSPTSGTITGRLTVYGVK